MTLDPGAAPSRHPDVPGRSDLGEVRARLEALVAAHRQTVQQERLSAFREMAGEVAHDFTDTLSSILARAQILVTETQDLEVVQSVRMIEHVALEGTRIVRRLQDFSRARPARPYQPVDLNQLVSEIAASVRARWSAQLEARHISGDVHAEMGVLPAVSGDAAELRNVLTIIAVNALDAMPEGGHLTFRTDTDGSHVFCHVADTGVGMSDEVRLRIFDPFFTTKREKGRDFGLSGAYAIVDRHGGEILVESEVGKGTTVTICLPTAADSTKIAPEAIVAASSASAAQFSPGAQILVVDDSKEVREVLHELLSRYGHTVVSCSDGESGLVELETRRFDLVIVDVGLPGISGLELASRLKQRWPGTTIALMTGYLDRLGPEDAKANGVDFVLGKPFSFDQVRSVIHHAWSRAGSSVTGDINRS
ncbi:MAG TPA: ATP-binding protein [Methylomirabilota bacterium]|nr:ATP-binding protein [Methylomirabilota bacterium]